MNLNQETEELRSFYDELKSCEDCPVDRRFKHEFGWGVLDKIMFIGQCPAFSNWKGKRGNSEFDKFFMELIQPIGLTFSDFYFTNLVKIPVKISDMNEAVLEHCATHLIDEVKLVKPKAIFALGKYAYQFSKKAGIDCKPLAHPGSIKYGNITEEAWKQELKEKLVKINAEKFLGRKLS